VRVVSRHRATQEGRQNYDSRYARSLLALYKIFCLHRVSPESGGSNWAGIRCANVSRSRPALSGDMAPTHGSACRSLSRKSDTATNGSARRSVRGLPHDAASFLGNQLWPRPGGAFSERPSDVRHRNQLPAAPLMQRACWSSSRSWQRSSVKTLPASKPAPRRGFVMTDELMLFLALLAAFTVVLVEWWARRTQ
jgi:hypothetical protein